MIELLCFICGAAAGFFIRHAYPAKFESAEAAADRVKQEWDNRK